MQKTSSILSLLAVFFMALVLSACGSKGDLYQTPDDEPMVVEETQNEQGTIETQPQKID